MIFSSHLLRFGMSETTRASTSGDSQHWYFSIASRTHLYPVCLWHVFRCQGVILDSGWCQWQLHGFGSALSIHKDAHASSASVSQIWSSHLPCLALGERVEQNGMYKNNHDPCQRKAVSFWVEGKSLILQLAPLSLHWSPACLTLNAAGDSGGVCGCLWRIKRVPSLLLTPEWLPSTISCPGWRGSG